MIFFLKAQALSTSLPIFTLQELPHYEPYGQLVRDPSRLCDYKKIVIWGIKGLQTARSIKCPSQERLVAGIIFISRYYHTSESYLVPLPSPEIFRVFENEFTVIYSEDLEFYIKALQNFYSLKTIKIKNWFELENAVKKCISLGKPLLLLPDPVLIDKRGLLILQENLKKEDLKIINLFGIPLNHKNEIVIKVNWEKYFQELYKLYHSPFRPGSIHYYR